VHSQQDPTLFSTFKSSWPLFFGVVLIMVGNGLQGTLLSLRATMEGFDITTTGLIMSLYYAGYVAGSVLAPRMLLNVGHIRVFAALASLASTTVLLHFIFIDPWVWGLTRVVTGFSYAGLYVVIESWLNGMATNRTRGKILSLYMFLVYLGMVLGQLLLNVADPKGAELFVLTSVLVSLALLPISLSRRQAPDFETPQRLKLRELYRISPLGVVGASMAGLLSASLFTIAPIYATHVGMSIAQISTFMAVMVLGGMLMQYPAGVLSDRIDRRLVMAMCCALAAVAAAACHFFGPGDGISFLFLAFLFWGFGVPIYALAASHTNDHLGRAQIVAASSSLILINGCGAAVGPVAMSLVMNAFGNNSFFLIFAAVYAAVTAYVLYRTMRRAPVDEAEKGHYVNMPARGTPVIGALVEDSQPE
jgi:MFS family permease